MCERDVVWMCEGDVMMWMCEGHETGRYTLFR